MASKLFPMSEDIEELVLDVMKTETPGLQTMGLNFKFAGIPKASNLIKVTKSNQVTDFLTGEEGIITIVIFEVAFERLSEMHRRLAVASALAAIEYDPERDVITINGYGGTVLSEAIYLKYREPAVLAIFHGVAAVRQVLEEMKMKKNLSKE
jgi:hypothetical protein